MVCGKPGCGKVSLCLPVVTYPSCLLTVLESKQCVRCPVTMCVTCVGASLVAEGRTYLFDLLHPLMTDGCAVRL